MGEPPVFKDKNLSPLFLTMAAVNMVSFLSTPVYQPWDIVFIYFFFL